MSGLTCTPCATGIPEVSSSTSCAARMTSSLPSSTTRRKASGCTICRRPPPCRHGIGANRCARWLGKARRWGQIATCGCATRISRPIQPPRSRRSRGFSRSRRALSRRCSTITRSNSADTKANIWSGRERRSHHPRGLAGGRRRCPRRNCATSTGSAAARSTCLATSRLRKVARVSSEGFF